MAYIVIHNNEKEEFEDSKSAEKFATSTGLGFPDVVITDCVEGMERFLK